MKEPGYTFVKSNSSLQWLTHFRPLGTLNVDMVYLTLSELLNNSYSTAGGSLGFGFISVCDAKRFCGIKQVHVLVCRRCSFTFTVSI